MARQGVFNRDVSQLEGIPRSLQMLEHRHTSTTKYGQILVNFSEQLYPSETLHLRTTNFLRTIPLVTPQFTRVRVVQRFIAVPNWLLWEPAEEYFNAPNPPTDGVPEEPYICNFNGITRRTVGASAQALVTITDETDYSTKSSFEIAVSSFYTDYSHVGVVNWKFGTTIGASSSRALTSFDATSGAPVADSTKLVGYQFFPNELGDYMNAPVYITGLGVDTSSRFSAWKFAAYQLAYSFFYRRPNIEKFVDDYYEMAQSGFDDQLFSEFPSYYASFESVSSSGTMTPDRVAAQFTSPVANAVSGLATVSPSAAAVISAGGVRNYVGKYYNPTGISSSRAATNYAASSATQKYCEWERCEKFPLKSGPNISMQCKFTDSSGRVSWADSNISLTRIRYAPFFMDRFTSSNPWPQRGDEALIPVNGTIQVTLPDSTTVSFSNLNVSIPANDVENATGYTDTAGNPVDANSVHAFVQYNPSLSDHDFSSITMRDPLTSYSVKAPASGQSARLHVPGLTGSVSGSASASFSSTSANVQYALNVSPSNFRFYMQLQHIKEMSGMTDGRYKSFLSMFYGSHDKDFRLNRPQFIGGFVQDLDISEIQQTSETANTPLGTLAGRGVSAKKGMDISFHAMEHTVILGLLHILPDAEYVGGLNRVDHTLDPFDWVLPQFSGLSEQPIRMSELCVRPSKFSVDVNTDNDVAFGYEPRNNELRARHSYVTGGFRDVFNSTGSRDFLKPWLITRNFSYDLGATQATTYLKQLDFNVPSLSKEFISSAHNISYANFAVTDPSFMYPFMLDSYHQERVTRIIPSRGIPRI